MSLTLHATLTAAAGESGENRVAEGILVPWGQPGRTNLGPKTVRRGAVRMVAEAPVIGLYGHDRDRSVSRLIAAEDRDEGLWGRLRIAETPTGDLLLSELRAGVRDGLSVELSDLQFDPADPDTVTAARLDAVAHVPLPAYDSARVHTLAATLNTDGEPVTQPAPAADPAPDLAAELAELRASMASLTASVSGAPSAASVSGAPSAATVSGAPSAATVLSTAGLPGPSGGAVVNDVDRLATLQAAVATGTANAEMRAALADITNTDLPIFQQPSGSIGELLWANRGYTRRFVPLLTGRPLTSYKFSGWEFTQGPEVGDWAGDKNEVPTNEVATREIEGTAARLAGGWDIDRKYRDFGDTAFWTAFYAAQTESYARKSDIKAAAAIVASAQDVTGTSPVTGYTRPSGFGTVAAQADVLRAVAFGTAYLEETPLIEQGPDYVLMNTADYMSLLDVAQLDAPQFLNLFGVQPGSFIRTNRVPAGSIVLGVKRALEWYELPGAAPIRVEALDVAKGGIDSAVYGYWGTLHVRPGGIISVPIA